jgi:hypothetical protein
LTKRIAWIFLLALQVVVAIGTVPAGANGVPDQVKMETTVQKGTDGGYYLEVVLKNDSSRSISLSAIKLPWATDHWDSWIKAFRLDPKKTHLEPGGVLVDYGGHVVIKPNDSLKGRVALHAMFRTLSDDINAGGVMIEWRCPTELVPVACRTQMSRSVISKTGIRDVTPTASTPQAR